MKVAGAVVLGLLIAAFGQYLTFFLAAGGEGWITPSWASLLLWLAYPVALVRAVNVFWRGRTSSQMDWTLVILALLSDAVLAVQTYREGIQYFHRVLDAGFLAQLWIAIWLGWQGVAVLSLARAKGYLHRSLGYADPFEEDA